MLKTRFARLGLLLQAVVAVCAIQTLTAQDPDPSNNLIVTVIDKADVPAAKDGVIAELRVREGVSVRSGQVLAKLDDREARLRHAAAKTEFVIAENKLANSHHVELAEKKLAQQEQLKRQHELALQMASAKADNDVRILASQKAEAVAKNELGRATQAREQFTDSVSQSEIDNLQLAYERTMLETRQASFERRLDALQLRAEQEASDSFQLGIDRSQIELNAVLADTRIAELDVELGHQRQQLTELAIDQHQVVAPWPGMVAKRFRNQGEWVKLGEPVVRLIRLDRLRAEGYATPNLATRLRANSTVNLIIDIGDGQTVRREGEVVFMSPELDPVNQERAFWIEFDNPELDVLPGMRLRLKLAP